MYKFLIIFLIMHISLIFGSQFEIVSELKVKPMHLELSQLSDNQKLDNRGELGALVIVHCNLKDVFFDNMASKISIIPKSAPYWVVMKQKAQYFMLKKDGFANYRYDFPFPLKSGMVYEMSIDEKNRQPDEVTVVITSNQEDAEVYVKGKLVGRTIDRIFTGKLHIGDNIIELRKQGFETAILNHKVTLEDNRMEINLEPSLPAVVKITSEPQGAFVYIDNIWFGVTPIDSYFNVGTYPIRIGKDNYDTISSQITINEPETNQNYVLVRSYLSISDDEFEIGNQDLTASLTINTSEFCEIRLNDVVYPEVKNLKLPASVVIVEVSQPNSQTIKQVITLKANDNKTLNIYPKVETGTLMVLAIPTTAEIDLLSESDKHYLAIGRKSFTELPVGIYKISINNEGFLSHEETVILEANDVIQKQITLISEDSELGSSNPLKITNMNEKYNNLIFVQGGNFQMGAINGDSDEKPIHSVTVSSFYLNKYEVTQAEWVEVMGRIRTSNFNENNPITGITWYQAIEFCNKKSEIDGLEKVYSGSGDDIICDFNKSGYRLPTEAEWEYAARGGNKSKGYIYPGSDNLDDVAWYNDNTAEKTYPGGEKLPNELGIYDMLGNVWERCWDWYGTYGDEALTDPTGPKIGTQRINRGASWKNNDSFCRISNRYQTLPKNKNNFIGMRLARSAK